MKVLDGGLVGPTEGRKKITFEIHNRTEHLSTILLVCLVNGVPKYSTVLICWPSPILNWRVAYVKRKMASLVEAEGKYNANYRGLNS